MSLYRVKPQIDPLEREAREIDRRRQRNSQRAQRILQPKTRILGVDTKALSQQVKERQERERLDLERNQYFDNLSGRHAQELTELVRTQALERRKEQQELEFFRAHQVKDKRMRELMERSGLQNTADFDTTFLQFAGEDQDYAARKTAQQAQLKDWLAQQIDMLRSKEANELQDKVAYEEMQKKINDIKCQMESEANARRAVEAQQFVEVNRRAADDRKAQERMQQQLDQQQKDAEIQHTLTSDFMTEKVQNRVMGGARACTNNLPYHFKGFGTDRRQYIIDEQKRQMDEMAALREHKAAQTQEYEKQQEDVRRTLLLQEREKVRNANVERQALVVQNQKSAQEHKLRTHYLDHVVYANPVSDEFFGQFGTSCR